MEIQTNLKITDYLDIIQNLYNGTVSPFRKQNQNPRYVDMGSNHPTQVFKHIPNSIEHRLSTNSSNIDIFEQSKQDYEKALKNSGYNVKLRYKNSIETPNTQKRKNRPWRILWFTPPYNMEVVNKLDREFFKLLKRNFPITNPLHKIFNTNNIKLSYSCIPNINSIINKFNIMKLNKENRNEAPKCNCKDKAGCCLKGKCQYECIFYKMEVYNGEPRNGKNKKVYFGSTCDVTPTAPTLHQLLRTISLLGQ